MGKINRIHLGTSLMGLFLLGLAALGIWGSFNGGTISIFILSGITIFTILSAIIFYIMIKNGLKSQNEADTFKKYLAGLNSPAVAIDKDFTVTYMNEAGAKVLGKTVENCLKQKCYDLFEGKC